MGNVNMEATQIHFRGTGGGTVAQKLQALADAIDGMPTFTSNDRDFLDDWESILPISDEVPEGQYVLSATKSELGATYSWEEPESGIINYSTTEQATGQKWIDGKDIYTKMIVVDNPEYTQVGQIYESSLPFDMTGLDTVLVEWCQALTSTSARPLNNCRTDIDTFGYYTTRKPNNDIYVAVSSNTYTKFIAKVIYTKASA